MTERKDALIGLSVLLLALVAVIFGYKLFGPEQPNVGPVDVSVIDANGYTLPYVRVEIEDLKRGYKSEAQNFGRFFDGPFLRRQA